MATKLNTDELLDVFKNMSVLELNEFLKAFEEEFGVTAAAPVAVAAGAAAGAPAEAAAEEQDEFDVVLAEAGSEKIKVITEVRSLTSLGLKEAKDLESASKPVLEKGRRRRTPPGRQRTARRLRRHRASRGQSVLAGRAAFLASGVATRYAG